MERKQHPAEGLNSYLFLKYFEESYVNFAGLKIFAIFANGNFFSLKTGKNSNNSLELVKTSKKFDQEPGACKNGQKFE